MKRILAAAVLAILCHTALLGIDIGWFVDNTVTLPKSKVVTVTMSYRQPDPVPEIKKEPIKRPRIKPKKTVRIPDKKPEPIPPESIVKRPDEPEPAPYEEETETTGPDEPEEHSSDEEEIVLEAQGDNISNMQVFQEAFPLYRKNPPPKYPRAARKRGCQGTVVLSVLVEEDGRVSNLWVFTSSGFRLLDNAAVKAVRNWAFEPGMKGNKKVAMWVKVPIKFQLK